MEQILRIIELIEITSSRTEKETILKTNKDNKLLQKVLEYTYNPYKIYGVSKKSLIKTYDFYNTPILHQDIFSILDWLQTVNRSNEVVDIVNAFLDKNHEFKELYTKILLKDLRCGISDKTINKIFKGLIPTFDVMLAKAYKDFSHRVKGEFIVTTKLDGSRVVCYRDGDSVKIFTRQGSPIEGIIDLEEDLLKLPNRIVFDGEIIATNKNGLCSKDLFRLTRKLVSKDGEKTGLEFHCFDMLPLEDFQKGVCNLECSKRKKLLESILNDQKLKCVKYVPILYIGEDKAIIDKLHREAVENELEGVMVNMSNSPYVCKRTDQLLKVKEFHSVDLRVLGVQEGDGKNKDKVGAIIVDYKGYPVGVGSKLTDSDREELWAMKEELIGRVIEVGYFEETSNEKGELSLRFPTFIQLREKGKEVSYD